MKLPNLEAAEVSYEKVVAYLLNPEHPDGAGKAQFFAARGFNADQWEILADALRRLVKQRPVVSQPTGKSIL